MEKTRLGISIGLAAAICYFMGIISVYSLIIVAGYILLFESSKWLKKSALKAVIIYIVFAVLTAFISMGDNVFNFIEGIIGWFTDSPVITYPLNLDKLILNGLNFVEKLLFIILGLSALKHQDYSVNYVDKKIDEHMQTD